MKPNPNELTIENSAVLLIDHQPAVGLCAPSLRADVLVNNVAGLAKAAKVLGVPTVLTTVGAKGSVLVDPIFKEISDVFPETTPIDRTSTHAWSHPEVRAAVEATRRKKLIMAGILTEVCLAQSVLAALKDGFDVFFVSDCSAGSSQEAHDDAKARMTAAGARPINWIAVTAEWTPDYLEPERAATRPCLGAAWERRGDVDRLRLRADQGGRGAGTGLPQGRMIQSPMQIGIDSFAAAYDDAGLAESPSVRASPPGRADRAGRPGRPRLLRHRRAPPQGVPRLGAGGDSRRCRGAHRDDSARPARSPCSAPSTRCGSSSSSRPWTCSRTGAPRWSSGAARSSTRSRSSASRSRTTTRLFEENLDLLLTLREQRAGHWSGALPPAAHRPGRLSAPGAESVADLDRRRRDAEVVRARRRARPAAHGGDHRRRDAALQAADRPLLRERRALRASAASGSRSASTRWATWRGRRRRRRTTSIPGSRRRSPVSPRSAAGRR